MAVGSLFAEGAQAQSPSTEPPERSCIRGRGRQCDQPDAGAFAISTKSYTASVANGIDEIAVTPTVNEGITTVEYLDADDMGIDDHEDFYDGDDQVNNKHRMMTFNHA